MNYRCEATTLTGFVQQLAANILPHGYWLYVRGVVPEGKEPQAVDQKLMAKYEIDISRQQRARRKLAGQANLHYLRLGRDWIILATKGEHRFFTEEAASIRDARKIPIQIGGYSLRVARGGFLKKGEGEPFATPDSRYRVRVQISRQSYRDIRAHLVSLACHRSPKNLAKELWALQYEPYAPIRRQLLNVLRLVNKARSEAGYAKLSPDVLRYKRQIVKPFETETEVTKDELDDAVVLASAPPSHLSAGFLAGPC